MRTSRLALLMPDYKFDVEELTPIKGGSTPDNLEPVKPPTVCTSDLCDSERDNHIGECASASCKHGA